MEDSTSRVMAALCRRHPFNTLARLSTQWVEITGGGGDLDQRFRIRICVILDLGSRPNSRRIAMGTEESPGSKGQGAR
jgi:hypothetical protein